jgi:hypothetical protein
MDFANELVTPMTDAPPTRAELRALYAESDRFAAETDAWLADRKAAREAQASPPARENDDAGVITPDDDGDALLAAPAPEPEPLYDFTDAQFDALAFVLNELHKEFEARVERTERRLLDAMLRLAMPGERAEETAYALKDRVARMEGRLERQLSDIVERRFKEAATDAVLELPANFWKRDAA